MFNAIAIDSDEEEPQKVVKKTTEKKAAVAPGNFLLQFAFHVLNFLNVSNIFS